MGFLGLLALSSSPSPLSISAVNGATKWDSGITELTLTLLSGKECMDVEKAYCVEGLPVQLMRHCPYPDVLPCLLQCVSRHQLAAVRIRVLIGPEVPDAHWTLEQSFGKWKQSHAIRTVLGWVVLGPVDQCMSIAWNINHAEAEIDSLTKQVVLL